jgi:hypothetical protein
MALLEEPVSRLVNDLIDGFIDLGEVDFAAEFSVPFPSQVFLTLFGLPLADRDQLLAWKDALLQTVRRNLEALGGCAGGDALKAEAPQIFQMPETDVAELRDLFVSVGAWVNGSGGLERHVDGFAGRTTGSLEMDELPLGEPGTIYFGGGGEFEYYNDADKTAQSRHSRGWSTLGDVGYLDHDATSVHLYLEESYTFTVLTPEAAVYLSYS